MPGIELPDISILDDIDFASAASLVSKPKTRAPISYQLAPALQLLAGRPRFFLRSNVTFFTWIIASSLILHGLACWPELSGWLKSHTGLDLRALLGTSTTLPTWRYPSGKVLGLWVILAVGQYLLCLPLPRFRGLRTLALVLAFFHNGTLVLMNNSMNSAEGLLSQQAAGSVYENQWPALQHLKLIEHPGLDGSLCPSREELRQLGIRTVADLHHQVMAGYQHRAEYLARHWDMVDQQKLKAVFILNVVSGLWGYGNKVNTDKPGGALANEDNDWAICQPSLQVYLASNIGNCTDFAYMSKALLDREGLENRLTCIPGHIFNEVRIDGRWYILDATTNLFLETSWEDLYRGPELADGKMTVHLFTHPGLINEHSSRYRPLAGHFRLMTLLRVANRPALFKATQHPDLPDYFK